MESEMASVASFSALSHDLLLGDGGDGKKA